MRKKGERTPESAPQRYKERERKTAGEESHIIELAAGNLTEMKNIFQPCRP
jgi:hypothetical protein